MRPSWIIAVLAGCAEPTATMSPAKALDLDVVLHRDRFEVFTNASDIPCECMETDVRFPAPGSCVHLDDILYPCSCGEPHGVSCITDVRLVGAERSVAVPFGSSGTYAADITDLSEPTLTVAGCTPEELSVPLVWTAVETPTLSVLYRDHRFDASWSGSAPLALVEGGWAFVHDRCVTPATTKTLPTPVFVPEYLSAKLSMLEPAQVISTDGAVVRVWSASDVVSRFFTPCREDDTLCPLDGDHSVH